VRSDLGLGSVVGEVVAVREVCGARES